MRAALAGISAVAAESPGALDRGTESEVGRGRGGGRERARARLVWPRMKDGIRTERGWMWSTAQAPWLDARAIWGLHACCPSRSWSARVRRRRCTTCRILRPGGMLTMMGAILAWSCADRHCGPLVEGFAGGFQKSAGAMRSCSAWNSRPCHGVSSGVEVPGAIDPLPTTT